MDRPFLKTLTDERIKDAEALLAAGRWAAAYYLAGYAVECALKACVVKMVEADPGVVFQVRNFSLEAWTHDPKTLMRLAGIATDMTNACAADPVLKQNWNTVIAWKETARYEAKLESDARGLLAAIVEPVGGVLSWIQQYW